MLKSSIFVTVLSILASVVSFFNQTLIARYFGAGTLMDAYLTISSVPLLIASLITSGLSYYLTPYIVKEKLENPQGYKHFTGSLFTIIIGFSTVLSLLVAVVFNWKMQYIYPNLAKVDHNILLNICVLTWLNAVINIGMGFYNCLLNANKQFLLPVIISFFPYVSVIICCLFFSASLSIVAISLGLFAGSLMGLMIGMVMARKQTIINFSFNNWHKFKIIFKYLPLVMLAMLSFGVYQSIDSFWAPRLGHSNLSYLGYCQRILVALGVLVITGPSTVLVPHLTEALIQKRDDDFYKTVVSVIKIVISLAAFIATVSSVLAFPIIQIMFQRGKFTLSDTTNISNLLPYMLIGMVFMLCVVLLFRVLFIKEKIFTVSGIGIACALLYFIFSGFAVIFIQKVWGIGLAYIFTWAIILLIALKAIFTKNEKYFFNKNTFLYFIKLAVNLSVLYIVTKAFFVFFKST